MKTRVLDSWAILEWISGRQPATALVAALLAESAAGGARLLMSAINAGEVYYFLHKHHDQKLAQSWRDSAPILPVMIQAPTVDEIWEAALLKARYPIAYADAFGAALALRYRCPLVTGDPELRHIEHLELDWIDRPRRH